MSLTCRKPLRNNINWLFFKPTDTTVQITNKDFADYIGLQASNLSALLKGTRRINIELALKLDQIFHINPAL